MPDGAWVVSYWADKSRDDDGLDARGVGDESVAARAGPPPAGSAACSPTPGRLLAGTNGHVSASTGTNSAAATTWSVVLDPRAADLTRRCRAAPSG